MRAWQVLAGGCVLAAGSAAFGQVNVALNKPVSLVSGAVADSSAALSTLTDGTFLPRFQTWTDGTVWWTGFDAVFEIDLQGTFNLYGGIVEADDNDAYQLWYHDLGDDSWKVLWDVPNYDALGFGMQNRPDPDNTSTIFAFDTVVKTDKIRAVAVSGDSDNAFAEIQVYDRIPAPGAAVVGVLGGLAALRRRR